MSGGHFGYKQWAISDITDELENVIASNTDYSPEVIQEFKKGLDYLNKAQVYTQRIDWLLSGDDGEESFLNRLSEELLELDSDE